MSPSVAAASQPGGPCLSYEAGPHAVWEVKAVPSRLSPSPPPTGAAAPAKPMPVRVSGVKRSGSSAFAPFPASRPAQRPRSASDLTGSSACDTASDVLRRVHSNASDCAESVESAGATPRSAAGSPQAQLLRLACTVLPKLRKSHPAAAALLTAQLRATILRGAIARAGRSSATLSSQLSTPLPSTAR